MAQPEHSCAAPNLDVWTRRSEDDVQAVLAQVASVDLGRIRAGLMKKLGWSATLCDGVEDRYRKFLALIRLYPNRPLAPTRFIDEFWHAHILDTRAYHRDCDQLFGDYLHHRPSHTENQQESSEALNDGFDVTAQLYRVHFQMDLWTEQEKSEYDPPICIVG